MFKSRIRIVQVRSKEDLRQKGAAAVFRAACSIRRSTPRGAVGRVRYVVIYPQNLYHISQSQTYLDFCDKIGASLSPAFAADPSALVRQNHIKNRS